MFIREFKGYSFNDYTVEGNLVVLFLFGQQVYSADYKSFKDWQLKSLK
jgi:hypothetical protein